jgi:hypothetical protein
MIRGEFEAADETPASLRAAYDEVLAATIEAVGVEQVHEQTDLDTEQLDAISAGEAVTLTLAEAASILAADPDRPSADTLATEARDILLMGMSMAVLDVEAVAAGIDDAMDPKEIQQKIEGRHPISLDEYALLHQHIEGEKQ